MNDDIFKSMAKMIVNYYTPSSKKNAEDTQKTRIEKLESMSDAELQREHARRMMMQDILDADAYERQQEDIKKFNKHMMRL